jgi:hypothetical protein
MEQDKVASLRQLGELKASGVLSEEEFEAEKAKVLAGSSTSAPMPASPDKTSQRGAGFYFLAVAAALGGAGGLWAIYDAVTYAG